MTVAPPMLRNVVPKIRIAVAGQDAFQRLGIKRLLEGQAAITVVGEATMPHTAIQITSDLRPQVLIFGVSGLSTECIESLRVMARMTQVVVLAYSNDASAIQDALDAGVAGCLIHGRFAPGDLVYVVIRAGHKVKADVGVSPRAYHGLSSRSHFEAYSTLLSDREAQVMDYIATGMGNSEIAGALCVSEKTIKNHINRIFAKLRVSSRAQAIVLWLRD